MPPTFDALPTERLQLAIEDLDAYLSRLANKNSRKIAPAEEADVCLGVRAAFNAFVDFNAWQRLAQGEDVIPYAHRLTALFKTAVEIVRQSNNAEKSSLYVQSIDEKTEFVGELLAGKTLYELIQTKKPRQGEH